MRKIFLALLVAFGLDAKMVGGASVVVKGELITIADVEKEMTQSGSNAKTAIDVLIRKKLEFIEADERKISVTTTDVHADIKQMATANNMTLDEFYAAIRESNGLSSDELKVKIKEKLISQKLYSAIAYSSMSEPTQKEIISYFDLHKSKFVHPKSFTVISYTASDKGLLAKKVSLPMFFSQDIKESEKKLYYDKISTQLAKLLESTKPDSFTSIVQTDKKSFTTFFVKEVEGADESKTYKDYQDAISSQITADKREQVLSDYFARLRNNTEIKVLREPDVK